MQYTVLKPFVFRGVSYVRGDLFDTDKSQCDPHRATMLMNQRYLAPGYSGQNDTSAAATAKKQGNAKAPANEPEKGKSEPDDGNEPDNEPEEPENEPESGDDGENDDTEDGKEPDDSQDEAAQSPAPAAKTSRRRS